MRPSHRILLFLFALCMSWQGLAGALSAAEAVRTRGAVYPEYGRLVFDWPTPVKYELNQKDNRLVVRFERAGKFELAKAMARLEPLLGEAQVMPDGLAVAFQLKGEFELKHFPLDKRVVIDLYRRAPAAQAKAEDPKPRATGPAPGAGDKANKETAGKAAKAEVPAVTATRQKATPTPLRKPETATQIAGAEAAIEDRQVPSSTKVTGAPTSILPEGLASKSGPSPALGKPEIDPGTPATEAAVIARQPKLVGKAAQGKSGKAKIARVDESVKFENSLKAGRAQLSGQGRLQVLPQPQLAKPDQPAVGRQAPPVPPVVLRFTWNRPTAAASFRYGGDLWLAFDSELSGDVTKELEKAAPAITGVRVLETDGATVLRLRTASFMVPRLTREDETWVVDIRRRAALPEIAVSLEISGEEEDILVRFPLEKVGRLLWLTDPETEERLVVAPVFSPGVGVASTRRFTQFETLSSQQGVALLPLSDSLQVAAARTGVLVRDRDGLIVSDEELRAAREADNNALDLGRRLFHLAKWRRGGEEEFPKTKQTLMSEAVNAKGSMITKAHFELARFYFAWGLATEAMGLLRVVEADNAGLAHDPEFLLMRAVSAFLMDDFETAGRLLADPALAGEWEAILWQSALAAASEDWQAASSGFAIADRLIPAYPVPVRNRLFILASEARLGVADTGGASEYLVSLTRGELRRSDESQAKYLLGRRFFIDGEYDLAERLWRGLENSDHRGSQAKARLGLLEIELQQDRIDNAQAIERLERLRFAWRGDEFELSVLSRLADLYAEERRFDKALQALQKAVVHFPDSGRTQFLTQRMREIFTQVFLEESHPTVPPIRALAIYEEFRELTPNGEKGELVTARLADRLVEVDLLDKAAELLQDQMRYRLSGKEKARVGARLGLVRLMDLEPELTLTALDESQTPDLPKELVDQRRHLRARALSGLERHDEALVLLAGDDSLDAVRLRAEVLWSANDWHGAALALGRLIPVQAPKAGLTELEANRIINYAIALTLSDDTVQLISLNKRYGEVMAKSEHKDAFRLLADDVDTSGFRTIAEGLGQIAPVQAFMASYQERLRNGSLSGVN